MKKASIVSLGCIISLGLGLGLSSCNSTQQEIKADSKGNPPDNVIIGMANPFHDCETLEDAAAIAGFTITLPDKSKLPEWTDKIIYRASNVKTNLLEIIYPGDENFEKEVRIRKALTEKEDISGDYNTYQEEKTLEIAGKNVKALLNNEAICLLMWNDGAYAYSLRVSEGITEEQASELIKLIK